MADEVKYSVRSNSHHAAKFSMLLPQQQQVANMTREIGKMKDDLIHLVSFITVTETTNESGRFNDVLANPTLKKSKPSPSWNKKSKTQMISLPNLTSFYLCQTSVRPRQVSDMTQLPWISETFWNSRENLIRTAIHYNNLSQEDKDKIKAEKEQKIQQNKETYKNLSSS